MAHEHKLYSKLKYKYTVIEFILLFLLTVLNQWERCFIFKLHICEKSENHIQTEIL